MSAHHCEDLDVSAIAKLVRFLRAGYPEAVPATGHVSVLALLRRRLTPEEVSAVAADMVCAAALVDDIAIGVAIMKITNELPATEDIDRIKRRLEAGG